MSEGSVSFPPVQLLKSTSPISDFSSPSKHNENSKISKHKNTNARLSPCSIVSGFRPNVRFCLSNISQRRRARRDEYEGRLVDRRQRRNLVQTRRQSAAQIRPLATQRPFNSPSTQLLKKLTRRRTERTSGRQGREIIREL